MGHSKAVRDVCWSNDGRRFLSCGYPTICLLFFFLSYFSFFLFHLFILVSASPPLIFIYFEMGRYDRNIKLWDSETGACLGTFTNHKIPYCVKFNPDDDKQHIFVVGGSDKKIIQWDINSGHIVQEYPLLYAHKQETTLR